MQVIGFKSALFLCCIGCFPALCVAQPADSFSRENTPFSVGTRLHYGFIIPHSKDIAGVANSRPFGLEMNAQWLFVGESHTRESGIITRRGFVAQYFNYDHPEVLGFCISLAPYVEPLIRPDRRLYGAIQMGLGVSYLSKVYDELSNPTNLFFSTSISYLLMTNARICYRIKPNWELDLGFNYNHISNGGMKNPNKGMNFPSYNLGGRYYFQDVHIDRVTRTQNWKNLPRHYFYVQAVGSIKTAEATDTHPANKPTWLLGGIAVAGRRIGRVSALAIGTEWIHDGWAREVLNRSGMTASAVKGGVLLGHELLAGKTRFTLHLGLYVLNPSRTTDLVYQRYGLFYRIGKHVQIGSTLKAHRHVADVFDIRLGWLW